MVLQDVIDDIHALYEDLKVYERKYGILSETFYELYMNGTEPDNDDWVLDWSDWAGAYKLLLRRQEQYRHTVHMCSCPVLPLSLSSILYHSGISKESPAGRP
jgi:hypothetical protein